MARVGKIVQGNPLDTATMIGAQASRTQFEKIVQYFEIAKDEGAVVRTGGQAATVDADIAGGYYIEPTIIEGSNSMRVFQEEIFGPVVCATSFDHYADAIKIANDSLYGLAGGVWTRNGTVAYRASRDIQAGRIFVNDYHNYPAHAAFGGYKQSGIGRENHKMMLEHYQQTKCVLTSYATTAKGFF